MIIYKYPLHVISIQTVRMHGGAKIISCQTQYNVPVLWAIVDPKQKLVERTFRLVMTGYDEQFTGEFIATVQLDGGALVAHVFEETK